MTNGHGFAGFCEYDYQGAYLTCYDGDSWNPKVVHGTLMIWSSEEGSDEAKQGNWATIGFSQPNRDNNIERRQMQLVHDQNFNGDPEFLHFLAAHEVTFHDPIACEPHFNIIFRWAMFSALSTNISA